MADHQPPSASPRSSRTLSLVNAGLALLAAVLLVAWFVPLRSGELTVSFTRGGAVVESQDGSTSELEAGDAVGEGDRIVVPPGASISITAPDGHEVTVSDSSRMNVSRSRGTYLGGGLQTRMDVEAGQIRVTGQGKARSSLDIGLPNGLAGVRGTEFNVQVAGDRAALSVHEGAVGVEDATGGEVELGAGQGVVVTAEGATVQTLPGTPQLLSPEAGAAVDSVGASLTWSPVAGATSYVVEVAEDDAFHRPISRLRSQATSAPIPTLDEDQPVFVRVSAETADGLSSAPSPGRRLELRLRRAQGLALLSGGDVEGSIAEFQAAVANYPEDVQLLRDLGWALYLAARYEEAREPYERALGLEPDDVEITLELARVRFWLEDYEEAEDLYQGVIESSPNSPDALWGLGDTYRAMGRTTEARDLLRRALQLDPNHPYAAESLRRLTSGR